MRGRGNKVICDINCLLKWYLLSISVIVFWIVVLFLIWVMVVLLLVFVIMILLI